MQSLQIQAVEATQKHNSVCIRQAAVLHFFLVSSLDDMQKHCFFSKKWKTELGDKFSDLHMSLFKGYN